MTTDSDKGFICQVCGEWHDELMTDIGCNLPDVVWHLGYLERYQRVRCNADFCTLDEGRHFIRCVLPVPFTYTDGYFGWGVWVEVSRENHDLSLACFTRGADSVKPFDGLLANALSGYRKTAGLGVSVKVSDEHRPFVYLEKSSRHRLARDQREGISLERHHEIIAPYT